MPMPPRPGPLPPQGADQDINAIVSGMSDDGPPLDMPPTAGPDGDPNSEIMDPDGARGGDVIGEIRKFIEQKAAEAGMTAAEIISELGGQDNGLEGGEDKWDPLDDDFDDLSDVAGEIEAETDMPPGDPDTASPLPPEDDGLDDIGIADLPPR